MNFLDKEFLSDPVAAINRMVAYMKQSGKKTTFDSIRSYLFSVYLGVDAKGGTNYAETFAKATDLPENLQEELRYKWAEQEEKIEKRRELFNQDPIWTGKERADFVICIQEKKDDLLTVPEDARVVSARKINININDFLKAMFLYVDRKNSGFICKAEEFNQDSYVFSGPLRVFF